MVESRNKPYQDKQLLILLFIPLFLLIIFLIFFVPFIACLKYVAPIPTTQNLKVLGISNFDLSSSKTQVKDSEKFNYTTTLTSDSTPIVNATLVFQLSGQGSIGDIQSPPLLGTCNKVTDLKATCSNISLLPNETLTWIVYTTPSSKCSQVTPNSLTMLVTLTTSTDRKEATSIVNCVSGQAQQSSSTSQSSAGGSVTNVTNITYT